MLVFLFALHLCLACIASCYAIKQGMTYEAYMAVAHLYRLHVSSSLIKAFLSWPFCKYITVCMLYVGGCTRIYTYVRTQPLYNMLYICIYIHTYINTHSLLLECLLKIGTCHVQTLEINAFFFYSIRQLCIHIIAFRTWRKTQPKISLTANVLCIPHCINVFTEYITDANPANNKS